MTTHPNAPAQRQLVHKLINWDRINSRLRCYPAIERAFPVETLKERYDSPPYYCHYMSWRLGIFCDESIFQRLERLLCCAEVLLDWEYERNLLTTGEFADFWSLCWQLQVAEYLCAVGTDVRWYKSGPDLSVLVGDKRWYVECYAPRKSFELLEYIKGLLQKLDPAIKAEYNLCLPFSLPHNKDRNNFLDKILNPFLDSDYLEEAKEHAKAEYPVILYKGPDEDPESSLYIYVEGDDGNAYMPGIVPNRVGDPKSYVELVLEEAVNSKKDSNALRDNHPNLLAVNFSLFIDYQLASELPYRLQNLTLPDIRPNIDALAVPVVGIDEQLTKEKLKVIIQSETVEDDSLKQITSEV